VAWELVAQSQSEFLTHVFQNSLSPHSVGVPDAHREFVFLAPNFFLDNHVLEKFGELLRDVFPQIFLRRGGFNPLEFFFEGNFEVAPIGETHPPVGAGQRNFAPQITTALLLGLPEFPG